VLSYFGKLPTMLASKVLTALLQYI